MVEKGKDTVRINTIEDLKQRREKLEADKSKFMLREQIIFFFIAIFSVLPLIAAFMVKDSKLSWTLCKIGFLTFILLFPTYLIIRTVIAGAAKGSKSK